MKDSIKINHFQDIGLFFLLTYMMCDIERYLLGHFNIIDIHDTHDSTVYTIYGMSTYSEIRTLNCIK